MCIGLDRTAVNTTANNFLLRLTDAWNYTEDIRIDQSEKCTSIMFCNSDKLPTTRHDLTLQIRLLIINTMLIYNLATNLPQKKKAVQPHAKQKQKNPMTDVTEPS